MKRIGIRKKPVLTNVKTSPTKVKKEPVKVKKEPVKVKKEPVKVKKEPVKIEPKTVSFALPPTRATRTSDRKRQSPSVKASTLSPKKM